LSRNQLWADAIKDIGTFKGELKYIRETLDDIKDNLKDCPKHQQRTTDLEKTVAGHITNHAEILKATVDLRSKRIAALSSVVTFLGTILVTSLDKIVNWFSRLLGSK